MGWLLSHINYAAKTGCVRKYMNFDSDSEKTICGRVTYTVSTFVPRNCEVNTENEPDGSRKSGK